MASQKINLNIKSSKPVKFTFSSKGKIIYKKRIDMDKLPQQIVEGLEIRSVSKVKNLTALARKKEEQAVIAAQLAKLKEAEINSVESLENYSLENAVKSIHESQGLHGKSVQGQTNSV